MNIFIEHPDIKKLEQQAEEMARSGRRFSDVLDHQGHQYVDLVQEGGGVLGIGLVGYTYIMEKAGIRFYSLAGTSAGSINTLLMASLGNIGEPVSLKILKALSEQNLAEFMDGNDGINKLIQKAVKKEKGLVWSIIWNVRKIISTLQDHMGINPGKEFYQWVSGLLEKEQIRSYADLRERRKKLPDFKDGTEPGEAKLGIVASEITTHTKVDFPRMAGLYWKNVDGVNPADFARASMSVPYFFYPYYVKDNIPDAGQVEHPDWRDLAGYLGPVPPAVRFVDGGMLSNFPINIFHRSDAVPTRPTFGARLSTYRRSYSDTGNFFGMSGAMISTMRQIHDYDFILRNPDYRQLICNIDADQDFNWLNFDMPREQQAELFRLGAAKAMDFLKTFDWEKYKETRAKLLEVPTGPALHSKG